jgi:hypothetical protein
MDCVGWAKALCAVPTLLLKGWWARGVYHRGAHLCDPLASPPSCPYHCFPASFLIAGLIDDAAAP